VAKILAPQAYLTVAEVEAALPDLAAAAIAEAGS
jgi:hypothetical protein